MVHEQNDEKRKLNRLQLELHEQEHPRFEHEGQLKRIQHSLDRQGKCIMYMCYRSQMKLTVPM